MKEEKLIKQISSQGNRSVVHIPKKSKLQNGDYVLITKINLNKIGENKE